MYIATSFHQHGIHKAFRRGGGRRLEAGQREMEGFSEGKNLAGGGKKKGLVSCRCTKKKRWKKSGFF